MLKAQLRELSRGIRLKYSSAKLMLSSERSVAKQDADCLLFILCLQYCNDVLRVL